MNRCDPIFFKKKPTFSTLTGDGKFLRDVGVVQGQDVCEIEYHDQKWLVRRSEIKDEKTAHEELANEIHAAIEVATALAIEKHGKPFKVRIAALMQPRISPKTLNKRMEFVKEYSSDYKACQPMTK